MLTTKHTLLPCGSITNWDTNLTMCNSPFFTTNYLFYAFYSAYDTCTSTVSIPVSMDNNYVGHLNILYTFNVMFGTQIWDKMSPDSHTVTSLGM